MNTGSILISGGSSPERKQKVEAVITQLDENLLKQGHPDITFITLPLKKNSIGINQIRAMLSFMSTRPYSSKYKVAVISPADKMTPQAQNALLKILEEPPYYVCLILSAKSEHALLSTLLSRCRKIKTDTKEEELFEGGNGMVTFKTVLDSGVGERLKLAEDLAKKDEGFIINQIEYWIKEERYVMTHQEKFEKYQNIELLLEVMKDVEETNVNTRLALENLFLKV